MSCLPTQPQASPLYTGFNSWNRWHCWVDEHKLKETADQLVHLGLAAAGYRHINIVRLLRFFVCLSMKPADRSIRSFGSSGSFFDDPAAYGHGLRLAVLLTQRHCEQDDCWQAHRALDAKGDFNGTILAEPSRFPSGLKGIADYIHNKKLFFGICGHKRLASSDDGCRACPFAGA